MGWRRGGQRIREMEPWYGPQTATGPELGSAKLSLKFQKERGERREGGREGGIELIAFPHPMDLVLL